MKIIALVMVSLAAFLCMAAMPIQTPPADVNYFSQDGGTLPVIKRLSNFRGDHFPGFAEFRVQDFEFNDLKQIRLRGEPYEVLLNVSYITQAYRYEDAKKTDHSTLVHVNYSDAAILIRQDYKAVVSSIRKGMEALSGK